MLLAVFVKNCIFCLFDLEIDFSTLKMTLSHKNNTNKRHRGLDACQQHCKISATDVSENVYPCFKMQYHENKIYIGR